MEWKNKSQFLWQRGLKDEVELRVKYAEAENTNGGMFAVLPHYNKSMGIKNYSVWYQDNSHREIGGENFGLKICKCKSFDEGCKSAEAFYDKVVSGKSPKVIGTQYFDHDTYVNSLPAPVVKENTSENEISEQLTDISSLDGKKNQKQQQER